MTAPQDETVLDIRNVTKTFGPVTALKDMTLSVKKGRVHTLIGENGAGKSTLMKILAGVHPQTSGEITFKGEPYRPKSPREARLSGLTIVFQELSLCRHMTVAENIFATHEPNRFGFIDDAELVRKAEELIEELGLPIKARAKVSQLSIARRQLVEIAKGLSYPADLVILDEPTSSLSESEAEILFSLIGRLKEKGVTVIYISHRMEEIMRLSDDITVIRDGELVGTMAREETSIDKLIAMMVGREMHDIYPPRVAPKPGPEVEPVLRVDGLNGGHLFHDVTFDARPGEVLGFFGLVGSGRSDVMNALFGVKRPEGGEIFLDGRKVAPRSPDDAIRHGIAFLTENRKEEGLVLAHTVERNINMVSLGDISNAFGFARRSAERRAAEDEVTRLTIKTDTIDTPAANLSGGNQQKIVLAKWLRIKPRILILDEPTRGVDVGAKYEIYRIIRQLAADGAAILMVSSDLPEVLGLSDRLVIMHDKKVANILDGEGLTPETVMTYAAGMQS
ncbi:sugar ABC transporter ATP-binding protein [Afifella sp. JA880]|uniref:sugar ABC transporter ATP-binding protein n=1 Tax=Afifella sp. JA880 TaxID=2975280 RepID=UPI0021BA83EF|nr:sugar ABC transporter ATP-binding protein [Afifella sp. JA880]MCT8267616.1 sugar ABC transporter ATP-binding protein [Afifella sp. JA880]